MAIVFLLLFTVSLLFYAVMFPELINIIEGIKSNTTDQTLILIYDVLPFALGFMLILSVILSIAAIVR
ncbi:hypothetical protein LCGC14_1011600 [marine sediment metagenome]|uniref:Uncharacterized protein n=1 Tax=marine sediment metagenome TaxID=412755 RepID=A0A0F9N078_9ZZZZ